MTNETNADDLKLAEAYANPHGIDLEKASQTFYNRYRQHKADYLAGLKAGREVKLTNEEREHVKNTRAILERTKAIVGSKKEQILKDIEHLLDIIDRLTGLTKSQASEVGNG